MIAQQITYLKEPYDTLDKILERIGELGATRYAGIVHDKDTSEEDHIQVFMCFPKFWYTEGQYWAFYLTH